MFELLTAESRRAVVTAQSAALSLGHDTIDSGHLLFGLLGAEGSVAAAVLAAQLDPKALHTAYTARRPPVPGDRTPRHLPFTREVKQLLESAGRESRRLGHGNVTTGHLLLAVFTSPSGVGATTLAAAGAGLEELRAAVLAKIDDPETKASPLPLADLRFVSAPAPPRRLALRLSATLTWYAALALVLFAVARTGAGRGTAGPELVLPLLAVALGALLNGPRLRRLVRTSAPASTPRHVPAPLADVLAEHGMRDVGVRVRVSADWHGFSLRTTAGTWLGVSVRTAARRHLPFVLAHEAAHLVRNDRLTQTVGTSLWLLLCACAQFSTNTTALVVALVGGLVQHTASRWSAEFACDAAAAVWAGPDATRLWLDEARQLSRTRSGPFTWPLLWFGWLHRPPLRLVAARLARTVAGAPEPSATAAEQSGPVVPQP